MANTSPKIAKALPERQSVGKPANLPNERSGILANVANQIPVFVTWQVDDGWPLVQS